MKLSTVFFVGSMALFASAMLEAREHGSTKRELKSEKHRQHQSDRRHGHESRHGQHRRQNSHNRHHSSSRHDRRHNSHGYVQHHRQNHSNRGHILGDLLFGGLALHAFSDYEHHSDHSRQRYEGFYWSNRHGECFKVEQRHHREVYIEVPRHRCH